MPEIGNRAPVLYGLFLVGQDKLPFGKLAVRHGLQLVYRCGGKLAHILVHVGHGRVDIINRPFPAVLGVNRNYVFFLNGKADIHTIKPLDEELIVAAAKETGKVVTIEEHSVIGGLGSAVCDCLSAKAPTKVLKIGVNDTYGESGPAVELIKKYGLDSEGIYAKVKEFMA